MKEDAIETLFRGVLEGPGDAFLPPLPGLDDEDDVKLSLSGDAGADVRRRRVPLVRDCEPPDKVVGGVTERSSDEGYEWSE